MHTSAILLALCLMPLAAQAKLYKWVDDKGRVHYSDTMPDSQSATRGTSVLSQRAIVLKKAESAEELEAKRISEAKAKQVEVLRLEQARRDKALLDTFANPKEIDSIRDRNVEQIDAAIGINGALRKAAEKRLADLKKQKVQYRERQKPIPKELLADIVNAENQILHIDKDTDARRKERMSVILRAEEDKKRLMELHAQ